jgi:alanine racemase
VSFGARALIRLGALEHNLQVIRKAAPNARIMAVLKANAYGHGMITVAHHLADVDAIAVARVPEAIRLHESGIENPIVLLAGALNDEELRSAMWRGFELVVHCPEQIELLQRATGGQTIVWLKFDTGMNRLGFDPAEAEGLISHLRSLPAVAELRLMTHLASADEQDNDYTAEQLECFKPVVKGFEGAVSIGNTAGTMGWEQLADANRSFDFKGDHWIRPGIALFGISPFCDRNGPQLGLKPVMRFEARLIAVKPLRQGARVGYKGAWAAPKDSTLGIISAGYGDGYSRHFRNGTPVLINGRTVPLVGKVSMDMIAVDLGPDANDSVGDIATLWGEGLLVEDVAPYADAIPYDLVCGVMHREASEIVE